MTHWTERALCAQTGGEVFFPEIGEPAQAAKAICRECPVVTACLNDALRRGDIEHGILGGKSPKERATLYREQQNIIGLWGKGWSDKEIAAHLGITNIAASLRRRHLNLPANKHYDKSRRIA